MKIYFCTTAPSKNYKSWSNIPYLLHKNLEKKGYVVKNYVMTEVEPLRSAFNLLVRLKNKLCKKSTTYFYVRTPVHYIFTILYSYYIRLISSSEDIMIVQGFSYPLNNGKNKQIIIGDWPSEYLFEKFLKRKPSKVERRSIDRENTVIENADAIVTLFPNVKEYMLDKYNNKNIYCFGNVVNVDESVILPLDIEKKKIASKRLLFIGQPFYISGAMELIVAAKNLRQYGIDCEVDIVGIDPQLIGVQYHWLTVHGYLDKAKPKDKEKFYNLLSCAHLFVNTTMGWSGFQALLEAMYFYNPIVVRNNEMLQIYFPNLKEFAYLLEEDSGSLENLLYEIFSDNDRYCKMAKTARKSVSSSTWEKFTDNVIKLFI
jgi:glycosyltransferase involved in cell wall biosynthesis